MAEGSEHFDQDTEQSDNPDNGWNKGWKSWQRSYYQDSNPC